MKRILFPLLALMFSITPSHVLGDNVSLEQARQKVLSSLEYQGHVKRAPSRSKNTLLAHVNLSEDLLLNGQEPFYIFNGDNSFYIVSSETGGRDILAYSDEGQFDMEHIAPTAKYFLEYYRSQIGKLKAKATRVQTEVMDFGSSKLLKTANLGQNGLFWWNACPKINGNKTYAGCGPAAMAIVMKYYEWPRTGEGSNSVTVSGSNYTVNFASQTYDWKSIPMDSPYETNWSEKGQDEVAKILYHCGVATKSDYGISGTSTSIMDIGPALANHFKYKFAKNKMGINNVNAEIRSIYSSSSWAALIKEEIDNDRPCIMLGSSNSTHIFVCDGYNNSGLFHFNLGWSGISNGYYSMDAVDNDYNVDFAVLGIQPDPAKGYNSDDNMIDGHEFVDLGLPSGKLWAATNYGASSPTSTGLYMDWNDRSAVSKSWGSHWVLPTYDDMRELVAKCNWQETTKSGVKGFQVTGPNGHSIFLPSAGWSIYGTYPNQEGRLAFYWTSTPGSAGFAYALYAQGSSIEYNSYYNYEALWGLIRPVSTLLSKDVNPDPEVYVTNILLGKTDVTLNVGDEEKLLVYVLPYEATNPKLEWTSSNTSVATVSGGTIRAVGKGTAVIKATATDGSRVSASCSVTVNSPTYQVRYYIDGVLYNTYYVEYKQSIEKLPCPTKEGYTFSGWSDIPDTMPAHDVIVEGTFTANSYTLTYLIGDDIYKSQVYTYGEEITPEEDVVREGYTFSGWSDIPDTMPAQEVTITGSFSKNCYKVIYVVGNEIVHCDTVGYGEQLPVYDYLPEDERYIFHGWTGEENEVMPAHDIIYFADITDDLQPIIARQRSTVYGLNGQVIGTTDDWQSLKSGIYIVNGKKLLKR